MNPIGVNSKAGSRSELVRQGVFDEASPAADPAGFGVRV